MAFVVVDICVFVVVNDEGHGSSVGSGNSKRVRIGV
jgi:hypothetical protein